MTETEVIRWATALGSNPAVLLIGFLMLREVRRQHEESMRELVRCSSEVSQLRDRLMQLLARLELRRA